jgi:hypothetical protein
LFVAYRIFEEGKIMSRLRVLATLCAALLGGSTAEAVLVNQYTFNDGTGNDIGPGNLDATIVDVLGITQNVGGQLDLRGNNGTTSANADASGAYVDLANGIVTSALQAGQANAASFEMWVTIETNRQWGRLFDFGRSDGGEGISDAGGGQDYLILVPQGHGGQFTFESHPAPASGQPASVITIGGPPVVSREHHIVVTYDQGDSSAGLGGTAKFYLNNTLAATGPISAGMLPGQLFDEVNSWLGRSQYGGDQLIDGLYNEFRIYDHALSAAEVSANNAAGPVQVALPKLVIDVGTGNVTIENPVAPTQQLTGYSITSAAGGLNVSSWDAIAPANGWTIQTQTATELNEQGGTAVSIAGGGSISLGAAWTQSKIEDLQFSYELSGGATGFGQVLFEGNGGVPFGRSDLDTDGGLDVDDWVLFLDGNGDNLAGLSEVAQALKGDLNGDDLNNHGDFVLFRQDYIAANGAAAFAALAGAVPEPSTIALASLASLAVVSLRRRAAR